MSYVGVNSCFALYNLGGETSSYRGTNVFTLLINYEVHSAEAWLLCDIWKGFMMCSSITAWKITNHVLKEYATPRQKDFFTLDIVTFYSRY